MKKKDKLINKIKHLVKRCGYPKYLHNKGPKYYEFWEHIFCLVVRSICRMSYRRTSKFLSQLGFNVASKSTLHRYARFLPATLWQKLLKATVKNQVILAAIDGTGIGRQRKSWHYIKRIGANPVIDSFKLSLCVDVLNRTILGIRIRIKRAADIRDVKYLVKRLPSRPKTFVLDKGYDAEWVHEFLHEKGIEAIIPVRNCASSRHYVKGRFRKRMLDKFDKQTYNLRNLVESIIFALKQRFGDSVSSRLLASARAELYCRVIAYNLLLLFAALLGTAPLYT